MHRWPLVVLVLLVCALGAAACGGGDDDVDVAAVLQQTFGEDKNIKSGKLDVGLRLDARGLASLSGPVRLRLTGPFASTSADQLPRFQFEAELDAGGQSIRAGAVSTGDEGFVTFNGQPYRLSDELFGQFKTGYAEQAKSDDGEEGVSFESLGVDPQRWLRDAEYEGTDEVGGVETLHLSAGIDVPRLLEDVNRILSRAPRVEGQPQARQLTEEERAQIEEAIKDARMELWTGEEDKVLRRLNVRLEFEVPEDRRDEAQGLSSGTLRFDLNLAEINEEQDIEAPQDARPFEELVGGDPAAGGGTGESGGGTGESGGRGTGESGGGGPATPYEQCVEEAGSDIAALQECASRQTG